MPADLPNPAPAYPPAIGTPHVYKSTETHQLKMFVSRPEAPEDSGPRPALVFFHGGGWGKGAPGVLNDQAAYYLRKGFVTFLVEYRLVETGPPELCIRDARSAMRWVRRNAGQFGVDPRRIGAVGGSAGAHLAACTALLDTFDEPDEDLSISCRPQCLVLFNPVLDNGPGGFGHRRMGERYAEYSPLHHIRKDAPPALILGGTADRTVAASALELFQNEMEKAGARCELKLYPDQEHGFYRSSQNEGKYFRLTLEEIDLFLRSLGWM